MYAVLLALSPAFAAPRAEPVSWSYGGTSFAGYVVYDDATTTPRPGVVMVPNWRGVTPAAVEKAKGIAGSRYVVLVADVYGKDLRPTDDAQSAAAAGALYKDRPLLRGRANAAVETLRSQKGVPLDPSHIGAIGFCFGGATVLEMARSGADLDGVVSFHGALDTSARAATGSLKTPIMVLHGAADTYVSPTDVTAFQKEMTDAGADWQLVAFSGAVHCFTEVGATAPACAYDARTAKRAYEMMGDFFSETFAAP